jgi:hypothetical protein
MAIAGQSTIIELFDDSRAGNEIDDFAWRLNQPNKGRNQGVDKSIVIIMV